MLTEQQMEWLKTIQQLPDTLEGLMGELSEEQLKTRFLDDEWTVQEIVHHMADSHMNSFIRLKLILTEDQPPLKPYQEPLWAKTADVANVPIAASLQILHGLHLRWTTLFSSLEGELWQRTGFHPELKQDVTPVDLLQSYAEHCDAHLDQIRRVLAAA